MDLLARSLQPLEPRLMMTTLYWDTSATSGLQGGSGTWSTTELNWNTQANGQGSRVAWIPGSDAEFSTSGAATITLSGSVSARSIKFNSSGYTLTGSTLTLATGVASGTTAGNINVLGQVTINNVIAGSVGLTKAGNGTLTLGGDNTFTGTTKVTQGTLSLQHGDALNHNITVDGGRLVAGVTNAVSGAAALTINNGTVTLGSANDFTGGIALKGGTLYIGAPGALGSGALTITGGNIDNTSGGDMTLSTHNAIAWNGSFTFLGTNSLDFGTGTITRNGSHGINVKTNTLTIDRVISGAQGFTKNGNGTLELAAINTYTGMTTVAGGTLLITGKLGNAGVTVANGALRLANAGAISKNTITVSGANTSVTQTVANAISGTASLVIHKGVVTLSSSNNYTGTTTIDGNSALLYINASGALGSSKLVIAGSTVTIGNSSGGAVTNLVNNPIELKANLTFAGPDALDLGAGNVTRNGNRTINVSSSALTIGGTLSGNYTITKTGTGVLVLNGNNPNTGNTTVSAGTLGGTGSIATATVANNAIISPGSPATGTGILNTKNLTLASGAKFDVQINSGTAGSGYDQLKVTGTVSINGSQLNVTNTTGAFNGTITIIDNDGSDAVSGTFAGLAEGAMITTGSGASYTISYHGGSGNDVVLTDTSGFTPVSDYYQTKVGQQLTVNDVTGTGTSSNTNDDGLIVNDNKNGHTLTVQSVKITIGGTTTTYSTWTNNEMTRTTPQGGTLVIKRDGTFTYTPPTGGFTGLDGNGTTSNSIDLVYTDGNTSSDPTNLQFFVSNFVPTLYETSGIEGSDTNFSGTLGNRINGPWTVDINWGDGSAIETVDGLNDGKFYATHVYNDNNGTNNYTASARATSLSGTSSSFVSETIAIANVAPKADLTVTPSTSVAWKATLAIVNPKDPSSIDTTAGFKYSFDLNNDGDFTGTGEQNDGTSTSIDFTYAPIAGSYIVRGLIKDKNGGATKLAVTIVIDGTGHITMGEDIGLVSPVQLAAPVGDEPHTTEGQDLEIDLGEVSDPTPDAGPYLITVDWGDGTSIEQFTMDNPGTIDPETHRYDDNGIYTVNVNVTNALGAESDNYFDVTVDNDEPTSGEIQFMSAFTSTYPGEISDYVKGVPTTIIARYIEDISEADEAAGFQYKFRIGGGSEDYSDYQESPEYTFIPQESTYTTIYVTVKDKDGGEYEFSEGIYVKEHPDDGWRQEGDDIDFASGESYGNNNVYFIAVNNGDDDHDGIPNYADGYNRDSQGIGHITADNTSAPDRFIAVSYRIPDDVDLDDIERLSIYYNSGGSSPYDDVSGSGTPGSPYTTASTTSLRLWTGDTSHGFISRTGLYFDDVPVEQVPHEMVGHYIPSDEWTNEDEFQQLGLFVHSDPATESTSDDDRVLNFYIEAIGDWTNNTDATINIQLVVPDSLGAGSGGSHEADGRGWGYSSGGSWHYVDKLVIRPIASDVRLDSDNTAAGDPETNSPSQDQNVTNNNVAGKVILVNNGDSDNDGTLNYEEHEDDDSFTTADLVKVEFKISRNLKGESSLNADAILTYDAATLEDPTSGKFRLWKVTETEDGATGDFVGSGTNIISYFAQADSNSDFTATLYLEALDATVNPSEIALEVTPGASMSESMMHAAMMHAASESTAPAASVSTSRANVTSVKGFHDSVMSGAVRLVDGTIWLQSTDFAATGWDLPWSNTHVITSYPRPAVPNTFGSNVTIAELPRLIQDGSSVHAIIGADTIYFDRIPYKNKVVESVSPPLYKTRYGRLEELAAVGTGPYYTYTLTMPNGGQYTFNTFDQSKPEAERGFFNRYTGPGGKETTLSAGGTAGTYVVKQGTTGLPGNNTFEYTYETAGVNKGRLKSITWNGKDSSNTASIARYVTYSYYAENEDFGTAGELKEVVVKDGNASSSHVVGGAYYRYDGKADNKDAPEDKRTLGHVSMAFQSDNYLRLRANVTNYLTNTDGDTLKKYATYRFGYDGEGRVIDQWIQGAGESVAADSSALGQFHYAYTKSTNALGTTLIQNAWAMKVVISRPDVVKLDSTPGNTSTLGADSEKTIYTNVVGQQLLSIQKVHQTLNGTSQVQQIAYFTQYKNQYQVMLVAEPSAVADLTGINIDANPDLLVNDGDFHFQYLNNSTGLITEYDYIKPENDDDGIYPLKTVIHHGDGNYTLGILQEYREYTPIPHSLGLPIDYSASGTPRTRKLYVVYTDTVYSAENPGSGITTDGKVMTVFNYTWSYFQPTTVTATPQKVIAGQNGSNLDEMTITTYDTFGHKLTVQNGDQKTQFNYSLVGLLESTVVAPGDLALTTTITSRDALGRVKEMKNPRQNEANHPPVTTSTSYVEGDNTLKIIVTPPDAPRTVTLTDFKNGLLFSYTLDSSNKVLSLTRTQVDLAGRPVIVDRFYEVGTNISSNYPDHLDEADKKFTRTVLAYDALGRQNKTTNAEKTIQANVIDALGRVTSSTIGKGAGTDYRSATFSVNYYDSNSNLVFSALKPDGNAAHDRNTLNVFDWRDRLVATKSGAKVSYVVNGSGVTTGYQNNSGGEDTETNRPFTVFKYNNLNLNTETHIFNGDQIQIPSSPSTAETILTALGTSNLRGKTVVSYDSRGREYKREVYNINQFTDGAQMAGAVHTTSGTADAPRTTNIWYNPQGQVMKKATTGEAATKIKYDKAGRPTDTYTVDAANDFIEGIFNNRPSGASAYKDASIVDPDSSTGFTGNVTLSQQQLIYDKMGNVISSLTLDQIPPDQQDPVAPASASMMKGSLTTIWAASILNRPKIRRMLTWTWYDGANRPLTIASMEHWQNENVPRTSSSYTNSNQPNFVPQTNVEYLNIPAKKVQKYHYNSAGLMDKYTDAEDVATEKVYDAAGRVTRQIEAYVNGDPEARDRSLRSIREDRMTKYEYTGTDQISKTTLYDVQLGGDIKQLITQYHYKGSDFSNDLLSRVTTYRKDPQDQETSETNTYNNLGEKISHQDAKTQKITHTFEYNDIGRLKSDRAPLSAGLKNYNDEIEKQTYLYDVFGNPTELASRNKAGVALVKVVRDYDGYSNLLHEKTTIENTTTAGATINGFTNTVAYGYTYTGGLSRLATLTYPDGKVITTGYSGTDSNISGFSGVDSDISRPTYIADSSSHLEEYSYWGTNRALKVVRPGVMTLTTTLSPSRGTIKYMTWKKLEFVGGVFVPTTTLDSQFYLFNKNGLLSQYIESINPSQTIAETNDHKSGIAPTQAITVNYNVNKLYDMESFQLIPNVADDLKMDLKLHYNWFHDVAGNRYDGGTPTTGEIKDKYKDLGSSSEITRAPGKKYTTYDESGWALVETLNPMDDDSALSFSYDAWGRPRYATTVDERKHESWVYRYDAAGRMIVLDHNVNNNITRQYIYYDGDKPIQEFAGKKENDGTTYGTVPTQSVTTWYWSPDGRIVARDQRASVGITTSVRQYAITDASGSVVAVTDATGTVKERFVYDHDGQPRAYDAEWKKQTQNQNFSSTSGWQILWQGKRWVDSSTIKTSERSAMTGLYVSGRGSWYNPQLGRALTPNRTFTSDSGIESYSSPWGVPNWMMDAGDWVRTHATGIPFIGGYFTAMNAYAEGDSLWDSVAAGAEQIYKDVVSTIAFAASIVAGFVVCTIAAPIFAGLCLTGPLGFLVGGAIMGAIEGTVSGFTYGFINGSLTTGTLEGGLEQGLEGAGQGAFWGALLGPIFNRVCFVAGTQVVVEVEYEDEDGQIQRISARKLARFGSGGVATLPKIIGYITVPIESLQEGDYVLARDEHDPDGELVLRQIEECFKRQTMQLVHLTLRSSTGVEQTLQTTAEHPIYKLGEGWVASGQLKAGDTVQEVSSSVTTVTAVRHERFTQFIDVYNFRVAEAHTYFVRAEHSTAEPIWVHNASYGQRAARTAVRDAEGNFANINPRTNRVQFSELSDLAGDHILPQNAFDEAIDAWHTANPGLEMPKTMRKELSGLMNSTSADGNLRLMNFGLNSSKGDLSAIEWMTTGQGRNTNFGYIVDLAERQVNVARRANDILGGNYVSSRFTNQLDGFAMNI